MSGTGQQQCLGIIRKLPRLNRANTAAGDDCDTDTYSYTENTGSRSTLSPWSIGSRRRTTPPAYRVSILSPALTYRLFFPLRRAYGISYTMHRTSSTKSNHSYPIGINIISHSREPLPGKNYSRETAYWSLLFTNACITSKLSVGSSTYRPYHELGGV